MLFVCVFSANKGGKDFVFIAFTFTDRNYLSYKELLGATTLSKMTLSIMTLSKMTLSIMTLSYVKCNTATLSVMTLSIKIYQRHSTWTTLRITTLCH